MAGSLVGHLRGGLGQVNIAASTLFGGISGSAVADASAVGGLMIPQMKARGYGVDYAVNVTVDAALIALLIPPCAQHDHLLDLGRRQDLDRRPVHRRHHAGPAAGPAPDGHRLVRRGASAAIRPSPFPAWRWSAGLSSTAIPGLMLIAIIFGGVRSGVFTATESSCIAVIYALLVTLLVYRTMALGRFRRRRRGRGAHHRHGAADHRHGRRLRLADGLSQGAGGDWSPSCSRISENPLVILLLLNVLLLLLGTFMDMAPLIIITHADLPAGGQGLSASTRCISASS